MRAPRPVWLALLPALASAPAAAYHVKNNDVDNVPSVEHAGGTYRGSRDFSQTLEKTPDKDAADEQKPEAPAGPGTLEDARNSLDLMTENWLRVNSSADGTVSLKDPDSGRVAALRFLRTDPTTVRQLSPGVFAADVLMTGPDGKRVTARVTEDLRTEEWFATRLELLSRKKAAPPQLKDVGRSFGKAVMSYIQETSKRDGAFMFQEDPSKRKRRLKLTMLSSEGVQQIDATHFHGPVIFTDLDVKAQVPVEFYVSMTGDTAQVYKTEAAAP